MNAEQRGKCMAIFNHYGFAHQLDKTQEELSELSSAIDAMRLCSGNGQRYIPGLTAHDLMDELADTLIMATQLTQFCGAEWVSDRIDYKLDRQLKRIKEEKAASENSITARYRPTGTCEVCGYDLETECTCWCECGMLESECVCGWTEEDFVTEEEKAALPKKGGDND